jgi:hypothetical protein
MVSLRFPLVLLDSQEGIQAGSPSSSARWPARQARPMSPRCIRWCRGFLRPVVD